MKRARIWMAGIGSGLVFAFSAMAANSGRAGVGTVEFTEGEVFFDGTALASNQNAFPVLAPNDSLRTGNGHAEVLLTPGVFLRLGGQASIRLTDGSLTNTRVRLEQGSAMIEVDELHKENAIRIEVGQDTVQILKTGLYRFDASAGYVQVLDGNVGVKGGQKYVKAGKHQQVSLNADTGKARFTENKDELDRWSRLRSEYEAEANIASAQYVYDMGWGWGFSNWMWNPWFGSYTWLPGRAWWVNPYGFSFFSPVVIYRAFPIRSYGVNGIHFVPRAAGSPSGLNLERTQAARVRSFLRGPRTGMALHRR